MKVKRTITCTNRNCRHDIPIGKKIRARFTCPFCKNEMFPYAVLNQKPQVVHKKVFVKNYETK